MYDSSPVAPLLQAAADGSEAAWRTIMDRYSPLVSAVCRGCGITGDDVNDVAASVWLRLVGKLGTIREPEALPGWLRTTARHESFMLLRHRKRQIPTDGTLLTGAIDPELDAALIREERTAAARQAFTHLPPRDMQLLTMLFADPPRPYKEISLALGIAVGAIGPTRARCLARARHTPAIAALRSDR